MDRGDRNEAERSITFSEDIVITLIVIGIVMVVIIGFEISRRRKLL